jgi:hypothetical protein
MGLGGVLWVGSGFDRWTTELTVVQAKFELLLIWYAIVGGFGAGLNWPQGYGLFEFKWLVVGFSAPCLALVADQA